jgi:hypothetical protein
MTRFGAAVVIAVLAASCAACGDGGDNDGDANTPSEGQFTPVMVLLGAETFVPNRTLPASALSAERLEDAGAATAAAGETIPMAYASSEEVARWELVSPGEAGWVVWRPQVVLDVLEDAGPGAALTSVEAVDWPDACLGAARDDEVCAQVITPGYRIIVEQGGETSEYHASRAGELRRTTTLG